MKYTLNEVFDKLSQTIDVVYLIDLSADTYTTLKDNNLFHSILGESGSYDKMMHILLETTVDKVISESSPYTVFAQAAKTFTGSFANYARIRIGTEELTISISVFPLDNDHSVILIKRLNEEQYIQDIYKNQDINTIKSAYLFSMKVDLIADKCGNIYMSEANSPANQPEISYSEWRDMILHMIHEEYHQAFINICDAGFLKDNLNYHNSKSLDCLMMNLEGKFIWVKLIFTRIDTGNDEDFQILFMIEDINDSHMQLMEELKKYENLATLDSLTELLNHGQIQEAIISEIKNCRDCDKPISVIMLDIDYFKKVNDSYGHAVGDYVLKTFSAVLKEALSEYDSVIGRWGGEEFVCVLDNIDKQHTYDIAEGIRKKIINYSFEKVDQITTSIGVIEVTRDDTYDTAFERLDNALYKAKRNGRNQVICE